MVDEKVRESIALFRYGLIAPIINGQISFQKTYLEEVAGKKHQVPYYGKKEFTPKTISCWLLDYRRAGFAGLKPKSRSDKGQCRKLNAQQEERLLLLRQQHRDMPVLDLDINMLKELPKNERNKKIQKAINEALGTRTISSQAVYTVCIDPGHGGKDSGATIGGVYEKDLNLDIAKAARDYLENVSWPTFEVLMTRETDTYCTLSYRHDLANNNNADIFISIHCDSNSDPSVRGVYGFYPDNHDVVDSKSLANAIIDGVESWSSIPKFGDARYKSLQVLRNTTMPATLTECGFMTNSDDLYILQTEDDDIGLGIGVNANYWCQANL